MDDDQQDELDRAEGAALLQLFAKQREEKDQAMRALLDAAVAEMAKEKEDENA